MSNIYVAKTLSDSYQVNECVGNETTTLFTGSLIDCETYFRQSIGNKILTILYSYEPESNTVFDYTEKNIVQVTPNLFCDVPLSK